MNITLKQYEDGLFAAQLSNNSILILERAETIEEAIIKMMQTCIKATKANHNFVKLIDIERININKTYKEKKPRQYFMAYKNEEFPIVGLENHVISISYGCDGAEHAISIDQVEYDNMTDKNVIYAWNILNQKVGHCDRSCGHTGFFSI